MWFEYEAEPWHLRLSVADKVNPGTIEGLLQEMKREGCRKGIVLTSTEFTPGAAKSAKGRPVVLIDGPTLYEIAEK
jgi:HJR/Mrr/RecB family endonuclease